MAEAGYPQGLPLEERTLDTGGVFHEQRRDAVDARAGELLATGEASELVAQERLLVAQARRIAPSYGALAGSEVAVHGDLLWVGGVERLGLEDQDRPAFLIGAMGKMKIYEEPARPNRGAEEGVVRSGKTILRQWPDGGAGRQRPRRVGWAGDASAELLHR
jgi:hypothetical protein